MKRHEFLKELVDAGCYLKRHGSGHDIYANPANGKKHLFLNIRKSETLSVT